MGNSLEKFIQEQEPQDPEPILGSNLERWMTGAENDDALRTAAQRADPKQSEQAQRILRAQLRTGLPSDVVERNLDMIEEKARSADFDPVRFRKENPALSGWVAENVNHLPAASEDLTRLGYLERQVRHIKDQFQSGKLTIELSKIGRAAFDGTITPEQRKRQAEIERQMPEMHETNYGITGFFEGVPGAIANQLPIWGQLLGGKAKGAVTGMAVGAGGAAVLGQMGPQIATPEEVITVPVAGAAGAAFGWRWGAAVEAAKLEGSLAYLEYEKLTDEQGNPMDRATALGAATITGIINGALEMVGFEAVLNSAPGLRSLKREGLKKILQQPTTGAAMRRYAKAVGTAMITEGITEFTQEMVTGIVGELTNLVRDGSIKHMAPETVVDRVFGQHIPGAAAAARMGAQAGGGFAVPAGGVGFAMDVRGAQQAKRNQEFFGALGGVMTDSKLAENLPEKMQEAIERITADGPVENVFAPLTFWQGYWEAQNVDPAEAAEAILGSREAYDEATRSGADLQIPTAVYARHLAGTEHHAKFVDELRLGEKSMNMREARELTEKMDAMDQEREEAGAPDDSAVAVRELVVSQLIAAGRDDASARTEARLIEHTFRTLGARTGRDPMDLFMERYGINISTGGEFDETTLTQEVVKTQAVRAKDGRVFSGQGHEHAMALAAEAGIEVDDMEMGYLTDAGNFVTEQQATEQKMFPILDEGDDLYQRGSKDEWEKQQKRRESREQHIRNIENPELLPLLNRPLVNLDRVHLDADKQLKMLISDFRADLRDLKREGEEDEQMELDLQDFIKIQHLLRQGKVDEAFDYWDLMDTDAREQIQDEAPEAVKLMLKWDSRKQFEQARRRKTAEMPRGFTSKAESLVREKMPRQATVADLRGILKDVKQEERDWIELDSIFEQLEQLAGEGGIVNKNQVLGMLEANRIEVVEDVRVSRDRVRFEGDLTPDMEENVRRDVRAEIREMWDFEEKSNGWMIVHAEHDTDIRGYLNRIAADELAMDFSADDLPTPMNTGRYASRAEAKRELELFLIKVHEVRQRDMAYRQEELVEVGEEPDEFGDYESYTLEGGTDYRVVMFRLPRLRPEFFTEHFEDAVNIFAHVRLKDRVTVDGRRMLFVEEIQSDWHQRGREHGYQTPEFTKKLESLRRKERRLENKLAKLEEEGASRTERNVVVQQIASIRRELGALGELADESIRLVPDAPFKKTWHEFVLKRVIRMAAEGGYDAVGWTTGEQQADRYDLSQRVKSISWARIEDTPLSEGEQRKNIQNRIKAIETFIADDRWSEDIEPEDRRVIKKALGFFKRGEIDQGQAWYDSLSETHRWAIRDALREGAYRTNREGYVIDDPIRLALVDVFNVARVPGTVGHYNVTARSIPSRDLIQKMNVSPSELREMLGPEITQQMTTQVEPRGTVSGDLVIGGHGMRTFYDGIVRQFLEKFGRKYGAEVGRTRVWTTERGDIPMAGQTQQERALEIQRGAAEVHEMRLTPQLRQGAIQGEFTLFQSPNPRILPTPRSLLGGFHSKAERLIEQKMPARATAQDVKNILAGAKKEELEWLGLTEMLESEELTDPSGMLDKTAVLEALRANRLEVVESFVEAQKPDPFGALLEETGEQIATQIRFEIANVWTSIFVSERDLAESTEFMGVPIEKFRGPGFYMLLPHPENTPVDFVTTKYIKGWMQEPEMDETLQMTAGGGVLFGAFVPDVPLETGSSTNIKWMLQNNLEEFVEEDTELYDRFRDEAMETLGDPDDLPGVERVPFKEYTIPGGENYRILLLRMPGITNRAIGHFTHVPAVFAHVRIKDRVVDGRKVMFIEELQSDWHQKGRDLGYETPEFRAKIEELRELNIENLSLQKRATELFNQMQFNTRAPDDLKRQRAEEFDQNQKALNDLEVRRQQLITELGGKSPMPDAPLKKNWFEFAMKRLVRLAAEQGYDSVGWTLGEWPSMAHFNLAQRITKLEWSTSNRMTDSEGNPIIFITAWPISGTSITQSVGWDALNDWVGKELADDIRMNIDSGISETGTYEGDQLSVGGHGMRQFYNQVLVDSTKNLFKKYKATVERSVMSITPEEASDYSSGIPMKMFHNGIARETDRWVDISGLPTSFQRRIVETDFHEMKLTPELKQAALRDEFTLYQLAYHGSQVEFNKFDTNFVKRGTWGWGIYFTNVKEIATMYRTAKGRLFKADIPDKSEMFDRTIPLAGQPLNVRRAIERMLPPELREPGTEGYELWNALREQVLTEPALIPRDVIETVAKAHQVTAPAPSELLGMNIPNFLLNHQDEILSRWLAFEGVPGATLRIDAALGSVMGGRAGDRIFVVFDDNLIRIVEMLQENGSEPRGRIRFSEEGVNIDLLRNADMSTFLHETGHLYLEILQDLAGEDEGIARDFDTIKQWLGVKEGEGITREQHEMFARGFERYLMEGKAPVSALRTAFAKYRAWLLSIYKTLQQLNVELTDEVRGVFDRLLATEEELAAAERERGAPLFSDPEAVGMNPQQAQEYSDAVTEARAAAEEAMTKRLLEDVRREQRATWKAQRAKIKNMVGQMVNEDPIFRALSILQTGRLPDGSPLPEGMEPFKINRQAIVDHYDGDESVLSSLPRPYVYSREGGVTPDEAAEVLGFGSGDALLKALPGRGSRTAAQEIEFLTDEMMREEHGDLQQMEELPAAAVEAIHTDKRAALLRKELEHLARNDLPILKGLVRKVVRPVPRIEEVRRQAEEIVARRKIRDIRPDVYRRAEAKANKLALEALLAGDVERAFEEKQRELLSHELYLAAQRAQETVEKVVDYTSKFNRPGIREALKKAGGTYLAQIDSILERFEFRRVSLKALDKRQSLVDFVNEQADLGMPISMPEDVLAEAYRQNYKHLTLPEVQGIRDAIRQIEHLARLKNKLLASVRKREFEEAKSEVLGSILAHHELKDDPPDFAPGFLARTKTKLRQVVAAHTKMEFLFEWLDGNKDLGPAWQYLFRPLAIAEDAENAMMKQAAREMSNIFEVYPRSERAQWYYKKQKIEGFDSSFTKATLLAVGLNWGNQYNREALMRGYGWSEAQVQRLLDQLDERDWQTIQKIWDYLDSFWPQIAQLESELNGLPPQKVEISPVQTKYGTFKGGYYPIVFDATLSWRQTALESREAVRDLFGGRWARAMTKHGHTMERTSTGGKPLRLELSGLTNHIANVVHDLTHRRAIIDVARLTGDEDVRRAIESAVGREMYKQIHPWLVNIAADRRGDYIHPLEGLLGKVRTGATVVSLGLKMTTAVTQFLGYTGTVKELGPKYAMKGIDAVYTKPWEFKKQWEFVTSRSEFMKDRMNTFDRDVRDALKRLNVAGVDAGPLSVVNAYTQERRISWFYFIALMDMGASMPSWLGAYRKAMDGAVESIDKGNEEEAIAYADKVVRQTQGVGAAKDMATVQRGPEALRMFSMFYSYFSVLFNQFAKTTHQFQQDKSYAKMIASLTMLWFLPAVLAEIIVGNVPPEDEREPEDWLRWFLKVEATYPAASMILLRDIVAGMKFHEYTPSAALQAFDSIAKVGRSSAELVFGDKDEITRADIKAGVMTVGYFIQLPARQLWLTGEYFFDWMTGEENPENPVEGLWRTLVAGKPRS